MQPLSIQSLADTADCLCDYAEAITAIDTLAQTINAFYTGKEINLIAIMNGGLVMAGHLLPRLTMPVVLDFIHVSRYHDGLGADGGLSWYARPQKPVADRHVLLVDDIFDEGYTLRDVHLALQEAEQASSVHSVVLAEKCHDRKVAGFEPDFIGLSLPDRYVFGMGMDRKGFGRNAPGIFALKNE